MDSESQGEDEEEASGGSFSTGDSGFLFSHPESEVSSDSDDDLFGWPEVERSGSFEGFGYRQPADDDSSSAG